VTHVKNRMICHDSDNNFCISIYKNNMYFGWIIINISREICKHFLNYKQSIKKNTKTKNKQKNKKTVIKIELQVWHVYKIIF